MQTVDHSKGVVHVPTRFRGPPDSTNGGVAAGLYACLGEVALGQPVQRLNVRLHIPPPLLTDLPYSFDEDAEHPGRTLVSVRTPDGTPVLSGWVSAAADPVMSADVAAHLGAHATLTTEQQHRFDTYVEPPRRQPSEAFNTCFVCGPEAEGGLRMRMRPVADDVTWLDWQPEPDWMNRDGVALLPAIASLDCTAAQGLAERGFVGEDDAFLLGTYDAEVLERPVGIDAADLRIITTSAGREGRKVYTHQGLFTPDGRPMILGLATWIVVPPEVAAGQA